MSGAADTNHMSELIGSLYEAALDSTLWSGVADRIATGMGSTSAVLKTFGAGDRVDLVETTENLQVGPRDMAWADHWHRNDLWVRHSQAAGLGQVVVSQQLISPDTFEETGFYRDWLRRLSIYHMVGSVFAVGDDEFGVLGVHRGHDAPAYDEADQHAVGMLLPHLQRALRVRARLSPLAAQATFAALERSALGILVVAGPRRRVLYLNAAADRLLGRTSELRVMGGRLVAREPSVDARLGRIAAEALSTAAGRPRLSTGALQIPRPGRTPLVLLATPVPVAQATALSEPAVLILVRDPERDGPAPAVLRQVFGLTPTEANVAAALARGAALPEIAAEAGVGVSTVRSHLKNIMLKTNTSRQAELVALLLRSLGDL